MRAVMDASGEREAWMPTSLRARLGARRTPRPKRARVQPMKERRVLARAEGGVVGILAEGFMCEELRRGEEADIFEGDGVVVVVRCWCWV
jgi:hypothetical protein